MHLCTSFTELSSGVSSPFQWAALHYAFYCHRAAVALRIEGPRRLRLVAFCNTRYDNRNAWSDSGAESAPLAFDGARNAAEYYHAKHAALGYSEPQEAGYVVSQTGWWLNGHTLCNVVPLNVWSLRGLDALSEMLMAASVFTHAPVLGTTLVINKRDSPLLRRGAAHPFPALARAGAHPIWVRAMHPPLSFYTGPAWHDVALPFPEAWAWATQPDDSGGGRLLHACLASSGMLRRAAWDAKLDCAVFRGTATGAGIGPNNQRLQLARLAVAVRHLDVGITAWNARDRVLAGTVAFQRRLPELALKSTLTPLQQSGYKIILCVNGHQAPSRLAWHLAAGCALVLVDACPLTLAPHTWLHQHLVAGTHYVRARADMSDVAAVVEDLLARPDAAFQLAAAAYRVAAELLNPDAIARAAAAALTIAAGTIVQD